MKKFTPSRADRARARQLRAANPELAEQMALIGRSSAAQSHRDRHAQARKGHNLRGGRSAVKAALRTQSAREV